MATGKRVGDLPSASTLDGNADEAPFKDASAPGVSVRAVPKVIVQSGLAALSAGSAAASTALATAAGDTVTAAQASAAALAALSTGTPAAADRLVKHDSTTVTAAEVVDKGAAAAPAASGAVAPSTDKATIIRAGALYQETIQTLVRAELAALLPTEGDALLRAASGFTAIPLGDYLAGTNGFRVTTESGVSVSTADRTAQSTLYLTPHSGPTIALYDGTRWHLRETAEVSHALSGMTSGRGYDLFAYWTGSAVALERLVWTSATARATNYDVLDGVKVKSGDSTRRLVASFYALSATTTADAANQRLIDNVDNRVERTLRAFDNTSHTYNNATVRSFNGVDLKAEFFNAFARSPVLVAGLGSIATTVDGQLSRIGVGMDSTTAITTTLALVEVAGGQVLAGSTGVSSSTVNNVGYHYMAVLESGTATGTHTFGSGGVVASWLC